MQGQHELAFSFLRSVKRLKHLQHLQHLEQLEHLEHLKPLERYLNLTRTGIFIFPLIVFKTGMMSGDNFNQVTAPP
jgi:hypothetical protein